jgi:stage II sporulation protein AA (anti-sigma F factor antagonist)
LSLFRSHACEIEVDGSVDLDTADELEHRLTAAIARGRTPILLRFAGCTFIDSSGIRTLLRAHRQLLARNGGSRPALALVGPSDRMRRALELTAIDRAIPVFATVAEAMGALTPRRS